MLGLASLFGMMFLGAIAEGTMALFKSSPSDDPADDGGADAAAGSDAGSGLDDLLGEGPDTTDDPVVPDEDQTLVGGDSIDNLSGEGGNDDISGGQGDDLIDGRGGDDRLEGDAGRDAVHGGAGQDAIYGGAGDDDLHGEDGDDDLRGGDGADLMCGHEGADAIGGDDGADSLIGGGGDDDLTGGAGDDTLDGGFGDDDLAGGAGVDLLQGGFGDDHLSGIDPVAGDAAVGDPAVTGTAVRVAEAGERDYLNGGDGDDVMLLGSDDMGFGGTGADSFHLNGSEDSAATISDYDPAQDRIVVEYDPASHPDPDVQVAVDPEDSASALILLDGLVLAQVVGGAGLAASDVVLQPMAA